MESVDDIELKYKENIRKRNERAKKYKEIKKQFKEVQELGKKDKSDFLKLVKERVKEEKELANKLNKERQEIININKELSDYYADSMTIPFNPPYETLEHIEAIFIKEMIADIKELIKEFEKEDKQKEKITLIVKDGWGKSWNNKK